VTASSPQLICRYHPRPSALPHTGDRLPHGLELVDSPQIDPLRWRVTHAEGPASAPGSARDGEEFMMDVVAATEFLARSTTLTSVGWIGYIIIGAIAGWIAGMIMKTKMGILVDIVVGIVGALIGGFLLSFFVDTASGGWWFTLFTAILGAVILLWVLRLVRPRTRV
jgi:uncharacterized membrane protein YeaQ/YmgE (transglycosylase-associated protein family)